MYNRNNIRELSLDYIYTPNWQVFTVLAVINVLISFWAHRLIYTKELYYSLLSYRMEIIRIDEFIEILDRFSLMSLLILPLLMLIKLTVHVLIMQTPLLIKDIEIRFKVMFRIMLLASIMLTTGQVVHYIWIYLTPVKHITYKLMTVNPLSLAVFISNDSAPSSSIYILGQFNLFEILWGTSVFMGLMKTNKLNKKDAAMLVFTAWAVLLFLQCTIYYFVGELQ